MSRKKLGFGETLKLIVSYGSADANSAAQCLGVAGRMPSGACAPWISQDVIGPQGR